MSNESPLFLNKVTNNLEEIRREISQRYEGLTKAGQQESLERQLARQKYREDIETTKKEFTKLGVVDAFNEIIFNNYLWIKNSLGKKEPVYNYFGKNISEREIEPPIFIPASINYEPDHVFLKVGSFLATKITKSDIMNYDVERYEYIGVIKKGEDIYEIGCYFGKDVNDAKATFRKQIKPKIVSQGILLDDLSKLVAVYKEIISIEDNFNYNEIDKLSKKNLLPHFP